MKIMPGEPDQQSHDPDYPPSVNSKLAAGPHSFNVGYAPDPAERYGNILAGVGGEMEERKRWDQFALDPARRAEVERKRAYDFTVAKDMLTTLHLENDAQMEKLEAYSGLRIDKILDDQDTFLASQKSKYEAQLAQGEQRVHFDNLFPAYQDEARRKAAALRDRKTLQYREETAKRQNDVFLSRCLKPENVFDDATQAQYRNMSLYNLDNLYADLSEEERRAKLAEADQRIMTTILDKRLELDPSRLGSMLGSETVRRTLGDDLFKAYRDKADEGTRKLELCKAADAWLSSDLSPKEAAKAAAEAWEDKKSRDYALDYYADMRHAANRAALRANVAAVNQVAPVIQSVLSGKGELPEALSRSDPELYDFARRMIKAGNARRGLPPEPDYGHLFQAMADYHPYESAEALRGKKDLCDMLVKLGGPSSPATTAYFNLVTGKVDPETRSWFDDAKGARSFAAESLGRELAGEELSSFMNAYTRTRKVYMAKNKAEFLDDDEQASLVAKSLAAAKLKASGGDAHGAAAKSDSQAAGSADAQAGIQPSTSEDDQQESGSVSGQNQGGVGVEEMNRDADATTGDADGHGEANAGMERPIARSTASEDFTVISKKVFGHHPKVEAGGTVVEARDKQRFVRYEGKDCDKRLKGRTFYGHLDNVVKPLDSVPVESVGIANHSFVAPLESGGAVVGRLQGGYTPIDQARYSPYKPPRVSEVEENGGRVESVAGMKGWWEMHYPNGDVAFSPPGDEPVIYAKRNGVVDQEAAMALNNLLVNGQISQQALDTAYSRREPGAAYAGDNPAIRENYHTIEQAIGAVDRRIDNGSLVFLDQAALDQIEKAAYAYGKKANPNLPDTDNDLPPGVMIGSIITADKYLKDSFIKHFVPEGDVEALQKSFGVEITLEDLLEHSDKTKLPIANIITKLEDPNGEDELKKLAKYNAAMGVDTVNKDIELRAANMEFILNKIEESFTNQKYASSAIYEMKGLVKDTTATMRSLWNGDRVKMARGRFDKYEQITTLIEKYNAWETLNDYERRLSESELQNCIEAMRTGNSSLEEIDMLNAARKNPGKAAEYFAPKFGASYRELTKSIRESGIFEAKNYHGALDTNDPGVDFVVNFTIRELPKVIVSNYAMRLARVPAWAKKALDGIGMIIDGYETMEKPRNGGDSAIQAGGKSLGKGLLGYATGTIIDGVW